jgi:hypothetical protein
MRKRNKRGGTRTMRMVVKFIQVPRQDSLSGSQLSEMFLVLVRTREVSSGTSPDNAIAHDGARRKASHRFLAAFSTSQKG